MIYQKKKVLLLIIMSMFLLFGCAESDTDNNINNNIEHGSSSDNNTDNNTDNETPPDKSKIKLQCNKTYYTNEKFTIKVTTDDDRKLNPLKWNKNSENSTLIMRPNGNTAEIFAEKEDFVFIDVTEDGTNYKASCNFKIIKKDNKPIIPEKTPIKLQCRDEYIEETEFSLIVTTDDNRHINNIKWDKDSDNISLNPEYGTFSARVNALSSGKVTVSVTEDETNYKDNCTFIISEKEPQIYLENYYYSFKVGETKTIKYKVIPKRHNQQVEIKQPIPEGYEFNIRDGEIEIKSLKEQGMTSLILVSPSLNIESSPITLSSSTDVNFTIDKSNTGSTEFDNKAHKFSMKIKKGSELTSYKLYKDNMPSWLHVEGPKKLDVLTDEYTFSLDENKRVRRKEYQIVFLPGNIDNINDKKAQKIKVMQDRNYAPEKRTIKFFKGAKIYTAQDFEEELNSVKGYYTTDKIPEYYLYENGLEGWYNANKIIGNEKNNAQDSNMCWMYAATNGLHWWLEHNKTEVEKYLNYTKPQENDTDKYNKGYYNINYIPSKNLDPATFSDKANMEARKNKSDIAKLFRQVYKQNTGGWPDQAILWYLAGKEYVDESNNVKETGFGFFKDVFPANVSDLVVRKPLIEMSQDSLNNLFEEAVKNDRIFLLTLRYNKGGLHAVNVWGYVVDEFGDVCEVYIGDNNLPSAMDSNPNDDKDLVATPVTGKPSDSYLIKFGLDIKDGDLYLMNLTSKRYHSTLMNVFYELDLGKKYFEDYFKKHHIK